MNRIKDKLAQSVRQARCAPAAGRPAKAPVAAAAKAVAKPPAKPPVQAAAPAAAAPTGSAAGEPRASAATLFPQRVWPD